MTAPLETSAGAKLVTVFGGSGFLGRQVVRALAHRGFRVRAACRRPDLAGSLQPTGGVGQVMSVQANVRRDHRWSIERAVEGADAVVNLVGILAPSGKQTFDDVVADGAHMIAECTKKAGIGALVHVSAIGADDDSTSAYARAKARGESAVLTVLPKSVVLRPSVMFGPDDDFFNKLGAMAALFPVMPLIGGGATRFQPAYVRDVAEAVAIAVEGGAKPGTVYELGGPEVKTFRDCVELVCASTRRRPWLVPLSFPLAKLQAKVLQLLPNPVLTEDQVELLKSDNVVSQAAIDEGRTFAGLGVETTAIEAVLDAYLWRFRPQGQFDHSPA